MIGSGGHIGLSIIDASEGKKKQKYVYATWLLNQLYTWFRIDSSAEKMEETLLVMMCFTKEIQD